MITISKQSLLLSAIVGAIIGLIAVIPPFIFPAVLLLLFFSAPIVIFYLYKNKFLKLEDYKQSAIEGSIIGAVSFVAFGIVFVPLVILLGWIFKNYYNYALPYLVFKAFWLFLISSALLGFVCALTNATTAMGARFLMTIDIKDLKK